MRMKMFFDKKGEPIEFSELAELAECPSYRIVARNNFDDGSFLSTIWTGINMSMRDSKKEIFETMYFSKDQSIFNVGRWSTEEEALKQHGEALNKYKP